MAVFKKEEERILFVHIPKTGGTSINQWIFDNGWTPSHIHATFDGYSKEFLNHTKKRLSAKGHTHAANHRWKEWGKFDHKFAVVRDPLDRMMSELRYRNVSDGQALNWILRTILQYNQGRRGMLANHIRPQHLFVDEETVIWKYGENQLIELASLLDLKGECPHLRNKQKVDTSIPPAAKLAIQHFYAKDYEVFGFEPPYQWPGGEIEPSEFNGKNIAVVGNSAKLLDQNHGKDIDSHDIVIRFNRAFPKRAGNYNALGKRTTHMSLVVRTRYKKTVKKWPEIKFFLPFPPPGKKQPPAVCKMPCLPMGNVLDWQLTYNTSKMPSSGSKVLHYLVNQCSVGKISVYGFDGLKSKDWYHNRKHWNGHSKDAEEKFLADLVINGDIEFHILGG